MKPKTAEQYVDLVEQAIFEIEEVRMAWILTRIDPYHSRKQVSAA